MNTVHYAETYRRHIRAQYREGFAVSEVSDWNKTSGKKHIETETKNMARFRIIAYDLMTRAISIKIQSQSKS